MFCEGEPPLQRAINPFWLILPVAIKTPKGETNTLDKKLTLWWDPSPPPLFHTILFKERVFICCMECLQHIYRYYVKYIWYTVHGWNGTAYLVMQMDG